MSHFKLAFMPFPDEFKPGTGYTLKKNDDLFLILIDSNQDEEIQKLTLRHELAHISLNHFDKPFQEEMEIEAEAKAMTMTEEEFANLMQYAI